MAHYAFGCRNLGGEVHEYFTHFPPKFLQKPPPYFFHGAFAPSFIRRRRPWQWDLIMSIHLGRVPTYPCSILYIVSKRDQAHNVVSI